MNYIQCAKVLLKSMEPRVTSHCSLELQLSTEASHNKACWSLLSSMRQKLWFGERFATKKFLPTGPYPGLKWISMFCGRLNVRRSAVRDMATGFPEPPAMCDKFIEAVYQMPFSRSMCNKTPANVEFILFSKLWDVRRRDVRRSAICNKKFL